MKPLWLAVPATLALVSGGAVLLMASQDPIVIGEQKLLQAPVRHEVTAVMNKETAAQTKKIAPAFEVKDVEGKVVTLAPANGQRPQFVYFVLDGCPCSFDAEPLFQELYERYKGKIDFISVTDGDEKKARTWSDQMLVPYAVVPDPNLEIIHAYNARSSVYSALVTPDGHIEKMWPGYSKGILEEQNKKMAEALGIKPEPFDAKYAPVEKAAGCAFAPKKA